MNEQLKRYLAQSWTAQANGTRLKKGTKKYEEQLITFLKGALDVLLYSGQITVDQANIVAFMIAVGRADEVLTVKE